MKKKYEMKKRPEPMRIMERTTEIALVRVKEEEEKTRKNNNVYRS